MVDYVWSVLCNRSTMDTETSNLSLIEVIEEIQIFDANAAPGREGVIPFQIELVTLWSRTQPNEAGRARARISFVRPSGILRESIHEYDIDLTQAPRHRHRQRYMGIPLREPGRHLFSVEQWNAAANDWVRVAAIPLEVSFRPQQMQ